MTQINGRKRVPLTATIITLNEEHNLPRTLESLNWADEVLVVDSGSSDRTCEIAKEMGARVLENPWPGYGQQKNFAQDNASNDWILNVDADEVVPPELASEIQSALSTEKPANGFFLPRKTFYLGRWIRHGGWYPNYLARLANRKHARWSEPNIHEQLLVEGDTLKLENPLHHYTFANIEEQILTNLRYSKLGSMDLRRKGAGPNLFKLILKPIWKFFETYFLKQGFRDGIPGFVISVNAAHSIFLKYAYLFEPKKNEKNS